MNRRGFPGIAALCALLCASATGVLTAARPASDTALVVTLSDLDPATHSVPQRVRGDGRIYVHGQENVSALLLACCNGNFVFDTNDNASRDLGRRLWLDFNAQNGQPATGALPGPFAASAAFAADVFIGTLPVNENAPDSLTAMAAGSTRQRRMRINWDQDGTTYYLAWDGPENDQHDFVSFKCEADNGSASSPVCSNWTATPGTAGGTGKAGLYSSATVKGKTVVKYYGAYTMPFSMALDRR
jgi:hypothetical protein